MARSTEEISKRQLAFAVLDKIEPGTSRKDATTKLVNDLSIGQAYAMTIFQQHREYQKKSGNLIATFSVRDNDKGMTIVTRHIAKPTKTDARTPEEAVKQYVAGLQSKIDTANKLDTNVKVPEPAPKKPAKKTKAASANKLDTNVNVPEPAPKKPAKKTKAASAEATGTEATA